jgi:hypothetical protein
MPCKTSISSEGISARSSDAADALARHRARLLALDVRLRYEAELQRRREEEKKKKEEEKKKKDGVA